MNYLEFIRITGSSKDAPYREPPYDFLRLHVKCNNYKKTYKIMNATSEISGLQSSLTEIANTNTKLKLIDST